MPLYLWIRVICTASLLFIFTQLSVRANAVPESVVAAVNTNNVAALETLSNSAPTTQQRTLAAGALSALRHEDTKAIAMLKVATRSSANQRVRAVAYLALSNVYQRDQHYGACYSAIHTATVLSSESVNLGYRQSMATCQVLAQVQPMRVVRESPGSLPITDEKNGVIRVPITVNGHPLGGMVDTGASFTTVSASIAKQIGIHILNRALTVGSSTERAVAMRLGIAKQLRLGNAELKNVVFIVVPDSEWGLPRGFRIDTIIGLPVLMALGRLELEFGHSGAPVFLYGLSHDKSPSQATIRPNMLLSGLEPLVLIRVKGISNQLRMELDTGSNITYFTHNAMLDAPALLAHAVRHTWRVGGVGGVVAERRALRLPKVIFMIGGRQVSLKNVVVSPRTRKTSDGVIGENVFRRGSRWTIDFKTMTFEVTN